MNYLDYLKNTVKVLDSTNKLNHLIEESALLISSALKKNKKILWVGNGGSASDCLHYSAELMGRFLVDRAPQKSISLTSDISAITAIGNDYGFENIFSRQVEGLGEPGDVLICISTSGNSKNVIKAAEKAQSIGMDTISLTGKNKEGLGPLSTIHMAIESNEVNVIQEVYQVIISYICYKVEKEL